MEKRVLMTVALMGVLWAYAVEDPLRYPKETKAKLVAKEIYPFGGMRYFYDLDGKPNTAEVIFHFPSDWREKGKGGIVGSRKSVEELCQNAAEIYSISSSSEKPQYNNIKGEKKLANSGKDLLEGLCKISDPISVNIDDLKKQCIVKNKIPRYSSGFKVRYVAEERNLGKGVNYYFDADGNPNTAEIVLHFPNGRFAFDTGLLNSFVPIREICYEAELGYAVLETKKMPSYFEFTPGVRVMTSSENNYLKGVYEPFSKDITEIREYPFRYTLYGCVFFMGKEYKKNGTTLYYFDKDGDRKNAEIVMKITGKCKECKDKADKLELYEYVSLGDLLKLSEEMAVCPASKTQKIKDGTLYGIYKKQKKLSIDIRYLEKLYDQYRQLNRSSPGRKKILVFY